MAPQFQARDFTVTHMYVLMCTINAFSCETTHTHYYVLASQLSYYIHDIDTGNLPFLRNKFLGCPAQANMDELIISVHFHKD